MHCSHYETRPVFRCCWQGFPGFWLLSYQKYNSQVQTQTCSTGLKKKISTISWINKTHLQKKKTKQTNFSVLHAKSMSVLPQLSKQNVHPGCLYLVKQSWMSFNVKNTFPFFYFQNEGGGRRSMMGDRSNLLTHYHDDARTLYEVFQRGLHISGG